MARGSDVTGTHVLRAAVVALTLLLLAACATTPGVPIAANAASGADILYVTDRAPVVAPDGTTGYGAGRDRSVHFGSAQVAFAPDADVVAVHEAGSFPPTPIAMQRVAAGVRRDPVATADFERSDRALQESVAARVAKSPRKEVVLFIHGYANTFDDAVQSTADICRTLRNEFVCIALTWPAAGKGGAFMGYNIDRESGEFAVADMKRAIRTITQTPGIERVHIIAHSRGTDILASVMQQLGIEAYMMGQSISQRFRIHNIVLFAPDIDMDVATTKFFAAGSDPDLPFAGRPRPDAVLPENNFRLTVYTSPNDRALNLSRRLFGSRARLGQLSFLGLGRLMPIAGPDAGRLAGLADIIEFDGEAGFIGHSYFLSNPTVKADLAALLVDRLPAGSPGRPLVEVRKPFWRVVEPGTAMAAARN